MLSSIWNHFAANTVDSKLSNSLNSLGCFLRSILNNRPSIYLRLAQKGVVQLLGHLRINFVQNMT